MEGKKKGTGVKVFLVIFIILFVLAALALGYGYTKYKDLKTENTNLNTKLESTTKDLDKTKSELDKINKEEEKAKKAEDESYGSDYAYSLGNVSCELKGNTCTKSLKVKYNEKNHNIKIEKKVKFKKLKDMSDEEDNVYYDATYIYKVYEDDSLIDTIKVIGASWGGTTNNEASAAEVNFDGYVYIFNKKYLGILYSTVKGGYDLNLYNNGKLVKNVVISQRGMGFSTKDGSALDEIEYIKFNGTELNFWALNCKNYNKATNINLTFDGAKISVKSTGNTKKVLAGGAENMMCYDKNKSVYKTTR